MTMPADYGFKARATGYPGLVYVKETSCWRFWDVSNDTAAAIGAMYPTKDTLLADLHMFAAERGYERAS